ncbi:MAG: rhodanese-like domain-containing protein, partial [Cyclobacteriaceae bacterium]
KELQNKLNAHAKEIELIDVRSLYEVMEEGIIASARHIELDDLRNRMDEIDKNKAIVTYCAKGLRGYLAATILSNHGFDNISNLGGGFKTWVKMGYPVESKVLVNGHF